jgi:eukaryotic-like serine/threonine-protein kinase
MLPSRIGRYVIEGLLGQGGMGAVYKARDPELDRTVAIKTVNPLLLASEELRQEYLERFRREARAAGRLSHPNIVAVYDLGMDGDTIFFVMEYVSGVSLDTILKEDPVLPIAQAQSIVEQVVSGLEEAHRQGIIHRDVKPGNVFIDERGRVKVGDFGIARVEGSELTRAGVGLGTPGYSAPELLRGGTASARTDVFALGVLAYRLFSGHRPFQGALPETLSIDILERNPPPPRAVRGEVPEHVSDAVMHALAKVPEQRTPSATEFLRELRAAPVDGTTGSAVPGPASREPTTVAPPDAKTSATVRVPEPPRRGFPWLGVAVAVFLVVLASVVAVLAFRALRAGDAGPARDGANVPEISPSPRLRPTPAASAAVRPPARPAATIPTGRPQPTPRPADARTPPFGQDGLDADDLLREAGRKLEEVLREERRKADEKAREDKKKRRGKKKDEGREERDQHP